MKVLHLHDDKSSGASVELHPRITLVRDLDPIRRAWLVDVLGRLAGGRELPASGELEAHGIRFDLDDESLALLGCDDDTVEAVVTAADLPGFDPTSVDAIRAVHEATRTRDGLTRQLDGHRAALTSAVEERDDAARLLDELARGEGPARDAVAAAAAERSRLEFELQAARDERTRNEGGMARAVEGREAVLEERSRLRTRFDAAQNRRRVAIAEATQAAAALEEARSGAIRADDPALSAASARERLEAAEKAAAAVDPDNDDSPLNRRLADLERRRVELARLVAAMGEGGSEGVAESLDGLLGASTDAPPVVAALALADTWRDLHQQISALEAGVSSAEREAEERVVVARRSVAEAESDFHQPVLTPEQISKVEASHTAVLESQDRAEGRFGGSRAKKRLEELRSDERRVLERLGFSTYADYMMSSSSRGVGRANRAILDTARANLAATDQQLGALPGAADRARRRTELLQRRDAVAPRVADLLGHEPTGPEAEHELRSLREAVAPDQGALDHLATRLTGVGINVGLGPHEREELVLLAQAYLAEERTAEAQRNDVTDAVTALDTAVDDLRAARGRGEVEVPDLAPIPELAEPVVAGIDGADDAAARTLREARWAEVESARVALADAQADLAAFEASSSCVRELEASLADAARSEGEAAEAVEAIGVAGAELGPAIEARVSAAAEVVGEAESALARSRSNEEDAGARITASQGTSGSEGLMVGAEQRVAVSEATLAEVAAAEQATAGSLAGAEATLAMAVAADESARVVAAAADRSQLVDDVDWQLLDRLARVRSLGPGGSVPLVLDDPFPGLDDHEMIRVMDRLAQIAGVVQVVVVSDRDALAGWADALGSERVGVHSG